jgi:hypothetical protein
MVQKQQLSVVNQVEGDWDEDRNGDHINDRGNHVEHGLSGAAQPPAWRYRRSAARFELIEADQESVSSETPRQDLPRFA